MNIDTILLACCSSRHPAFEKPWRDGEYVCATDGRILVRTSCLTGITDFGTGPRPLAEEVWTRARTMVTLPALDPLPPMPVFKTKRCEECGGNGKVICDYGHEHECEACGGTGENLSPPTIEVEAVKVTDEVWVDGVFARLLSVIATRVLAGEWDKALAFFGNGFDLAPSNESGCRVKSVTTLKGTEHVEESSQARADHRQAA